MTVSCTACLEQTPSYTRRHGQKLDFARIQALLYTIGLVYDKTAVSQTTVPSYTDHMAVR